MSVGSVFRRAAKKYLSVGLEPRDQVAIQVKELRHQIRPLRVIKRALQEAANEGQIGFMAAFGVSGEQSASIMEIKRQIKHLLITAPTKPPSASAGRRKAAVPYHGR
jgi:hypothetical protein